MNKPRALITGIQGFVGQHLTTHLKSLGYDIIGIDQQPESKSKDFDYFPLDLLDSSSLASLLTEMPVDEVYHLAAISFLPEADISPRKAMEINIIGTVSLFDALRQSKSTSRILVVGSSKEYDSNIIAESISEQTQPVPKNFYGVSKYCAELIGSQYIRQFGMDIRFSRSFNHTGPSQSPRFVCSDWAKQVADIIKNRQEPVISVGDLRPVIDFSDVRDVVSAYHIILKNGNKGEVYNVCSGMGFTLQWILSYLCSKSDKEVAVSTTTSKFRDHKANPVMIGDNTKLHKIGWKNSIPMEKTLDDMMSYWLSIES